MNSLEEKLRAALQRQEPPPGFAERVLSKLPAKSPGWMETIVSAFRIPVLRWGVIGVFALSLMVAGLVQFQHQRRMKAEGEIAKTQVMRALRIASVRLNTARRKVQEVGRRSAPSQPPAGEDTARVKG